MLSHQKQTVTSRHSKDSWATGLPFLTRLPRHSSSGALVKKVPPIAHRDGTKQAAARYKEMPLQH